MHSGIRKDARWGWSLLELLAVVAIMGVIASLLMAALGSVRRRANAIACAANLQALGLASVLYTDLHLVTPPIFVTREGRPSKPWGYVLPFLDGAPLGEIVEQRSNLYYPGIPSSLPRPEYTVLGNRMFHCPAAPGDSAPTMPDQVVDPQLGLVEVPSPSSSSYSMNYGWSAGWPCDWRGAHNSDGVRRTAVLPPLSSRSATPLLLSVNSSFDAMIWEHSRQQATTSSTRT